MSAQTTSMAVRLWTTPVISLTTFFLGFPGGTVISAINWIRMGRKNKAIVHLLLAAVGLPIFAIAVFALPEGLAQCAGVAINILILFYLQSQMHDAIQTFRDGNRQVEKANWLAGLLIALLSSAAAAGLVLGCGFGLALIESTAAG